MTTAQVDRLRLRGKVAVVTGAARGIGEAIARAFIQEGALVYLTDLRDAKGADLARSLGGSARYCHLDVRDEAQWENVLAQVLDEHEEMHVLVNNAGITGFEDAGGLQDPEHALLLASDEAPYLTGAEINVDGGTLAGSVALTAQS